jgi:hypothetical protein
MNLRHCSGWGLLSLALGLAACQAADPPDSSDESDFPDGPHLADSKADKSKGVPYRGGLILHEPAVANLYWGSYWNGDKGQHEQAVIDKFIELAGDSSWYGILAEYPDNQGAAAPVRAWGREVIDADPGAKISDRGVRKFIDKVFGEPDGVSWNDQVVYVVYTPPGTVTSTPWGATCDAVCGYHYKYTSTAAVPGHTVVVNYAVIPYGECPDGCAAKGAHANGTALDQMTVVLSHEVAEAITDPVMTAWTTGKGENEVGDLCDTGSVAEWGSERFAVQDLWSNSAKACVSEPQ